MAFLHRGVSSVSGGQLTSAPTKSGSHEAPRSALLRCSIRSAESLSKGCQLSAQLLRKPLAERIEVLAD